MSFSPYKIREIMLANRWEKGAALIGRWIERSPAVKPAYSSSVTDIISMDWVLGFPNARRVYDQLIRDQVWINAAAQRVLVERLKAKNLLSSSTKVSFGDLSRSPEILHADHINTRRVSITFPFDDLDAALGTFDFHVAVAGDVAPIWAPPVKGRRAPARKLTGRLITLKEVGVYTRDSYDFDGDDWPLELGYWDESDNSVSLMSFSSTAKRVANADFRRWRTDNNHGGDFLVFSRDVKRRALSSQNSFTIPA